MKHIIKAILFDFDDTLTKAGSLDFAQIRIEMGCPESVSILDYLDSIEDAREHLRASEILERHERRAAENAVPNEHTHALLGWLKAKGYKIGIITRNSLDSIKRSLDNFERINEEYFDVVITRDDNVPVKPSPDGVLLAARKMEVKPEEILVVGDYVYDIEAGRSAGSCTVFFDSRPDRQFAAPESDFTIQSLADVKSIVQKLTAS
jgi:hydrogenase expression/formation protein HypE